MNHHNPRNLKKKKKKAKIFFSLLFFDEISKANYEEVENMQISRQINF